MPPDIRSFFTPKSSGSKSASADKAKPSPAAARKAASKKRRVIDSQDEDDEAPPKQSTPGRPAKKAPKEEEKVEETTASSYFSSTSKSKAKRVAPVKEAKPKAQPKPKTTKPQPKKEVYADNDDDEADDIYAEAFQKKEDDYKEEPDDEDDDMDDFVVPDDEDDEDVKPKKRSARVSLTSRKRKAIPEDDDEEDEAPKKKASAKEPSAKKPPTKKPPAKKPRMPAKKREEPEDNSEVKKIHDAIPTVLPPTPPSSDTKKFNFRDVQQRPAPAAQGSKELPTGAENCLAGLTFVFTGVLDSLSREDGQQLVKRYGGKITTAPSRKTSYVVLGSEAGPKKLETIRAHKIKTIDEDGLFQLICTLPANGGDGKAAQEYAAKKKAEEKKIKEMADEMERTAKAEAQKAKEKGVPSNSPSAQLWTVKYAPTNMMQICGNKGMVEKLQRWLKAWPKNLRSNFQLRGADGSGGYRAVMIHGPPGIGKTTAAHLIAKLEGYDVLEYNASDTRSKKLMEETMRGVLDNTSLRGYFAPDREQVDTSKKKLVLIMDEVDGMSAGDRGGVGQLAALCRKTSVPIVCICNERKLPKMKPFDFVTMDLAFRRPDASAIRSRIASIGFREGLKLPANVIDQLVEGTRADIRQIINMLSTYKTTAATMSFDESKTFAKSWEKHVILKPWDIASKLLGTEMFGANSKKTLNEKLELYFNDHEFSYLMIQENYLKNKPERASQYGGKERNLKLLELADGAAQSISDGDLADSLIHGPQQHWSLMPVHGMLSTVIPSSYTYGTYGGGQMSFTSWLGNNSKQGKLSRFVKEIQSHIRLRASGDRHEVRQSYIPSLFNMLVKRLEIEGKEVIPEVIETMDYYFLTKDDWDNIIELGVGPMSDDTVQIPTQTKSTFTRTYNQVAHPMPFMKASSVAGTKAAKKEVPDIEDAIVESEDEGPADVDKGEDEDADLSKDKYVKKPKKKAAPKAKAKGKHVEDDDKETKTKATRGKAVAGKGGSRASTKGGRGKK